MKHNNQNRSIQGIRFDIKIKAFGSLFLSVFLLGNCLIHKDNGENLLAGAIIFALLLIIFIMGLCSDLKALKRYKSYLKENEIQTNADRKDKQ